MFDGAGPSNIDEKIDADEGLWTIDPDKEDEDIPPDVVIEEGGGVVGMSKPGTPKVTAPTREGETETGEMEDDAYGSEKGEDYTEWEGYEQEV